MAAKNKQHEANLEALKAHRLATIKAFVKDFGTGADYESAAIGGAYDTMAENFAGILISTPPKKTAHALVCGMLASFMREWHQKTMQSPKRESLAEAGYSVLSPRPEWLDANEVILVDATGKQELWFRNDNHASSGVVIDGHDYEFVRTINP
jgi:hypothetical protein